MAESAGLLIRYVVQTASRVRIPISPPCPDGLPQVMEMPRLAEGISDCPSHWDKTGTIAAAFATFYPRFQPHCLRQTLQVLTKVFRPNPEHPGS